MGTSTPVRCTAVAVVVATLLALAAGCGPADDAAVARETARKLSTISSGVVSLKLASVGAVGAPGGGTVLELSGPFSMVSTGRLLVADLSYATTLGSRSEAGGLVSTGQRAFLRTGTTTLEIPPDQLGPLALDEADGVEGLSELGLDEWLKNPKVSDGPAVGGVRTDRIVGDADVARALADVLVLARRLGLPVPGDAAALTDDDAAVVSRAVESARVDVLTGRTDRLLRRLTLEVSFRFGSDDRAGVVLGLLGGTGLRVDLAIDDPNREVTVAEPKLG